MNDSFAAPWGTGVKLVTLFIFAILGFSFYLIAQRVDRFGDIAFFILIGELALLLGGIAFTTSGYSLDGSTLKIRRLFWSTKVDLTDLQSAEHNPAALKGSLRLFGNGGFFGVSGLFRNKALGRYRAWITDPSRAVVLRFADRVVVVSPEPPQEFVRAIERAGHVQ
jgi:hypothetical protein